MSTGSVNNPYGRATPMIDKLLGDAFPIVKLVADNLELVTAVAEALMNSIVGDPIITQRSIILDGVTSDKSVATEILFDDPNIDYKNILVSSVRVEGISHKLYFSDCGYFTSYVDADGLHLTLNTDAPDDLVDCVVQWSIIYKA